MVVFTSNSEVKVMISPKRMFKAVVIEGQTLLPKIMPKIIKSIDVLQGDGGAGSIRQINFPEGATFSHVIQKEIIVDTEKLVNEYHFIECPMFGEKLESIRSAIKYVDSGDGGCIMKFTTEHHTKGDAHFTEEDHKASQVFDLGIINLIEEYLVTHPDMCA